MIYKSISKKSLFKPQGQSQVALDLLFEHYCLFQHSPKTVMPALRVLAQIWYHLLKIMINLRRLDFYFLIMKFLFKFHNQKKRYSQS